MDSNLRSGDGQLSSEQVESAWRECSADLRAFLLGVLKDHDLAAEVLQTVFHRTLEKGHAATENLRGWMFRVAYNEAMLVRRQAGREEAVLRESVRQRAVWQQADDGEARSLTARLLRDELIEQVQEAVDRLPSELREIVRLRIYDEKTFALIAAELNLPLGTVLTRMRTALGRLQQVLRKHVSE